MTTIRPGAGRLLLALALVTACSPTAVTTTTTAPAPVTYRLGLLSPPTTDNYWAHLAGDASVWTGYVLREEPATLFRLAPPSGTLIPFTADGAPAVPVAGEAGWTVTQTLRPGLTWSDGSPFTSDDVVFTYETAMRLGLGGRWPAALGLPVADDPATPRDEHQPGVVAVAAVDPLTVAFTFDGKPPLDSWPYTVGTAPILPKAFWEGAAVDAATLLAAPAAAVPAMGAFVRADPASGEAARLVPNPAYPLRGAEVAISADGVAAVSLPGAATGKTGTAAGTGGGDLFRYEEGPFVDSVTYTVYDSPADALRALSEGDLDLLLSPLGLGNGLRDLAAADPGLTVVANPVAGYRYLAFNLRRAPFADAAFRRALGCVVDRAFVAGTVLDGAVEPAWSELAPGDVFWANPDVPRPCDGLGPGERLGEAVRLLEEAGYRWQTRPGWDPAAGVVSPRGAGLAAPDGSPVPTLSLLVPGPGYDPVRTTYAYLVAEWAGNLGIPVAVDPTGFDAVVDRVFSTVPTFDMYILAWELTPYPSHLARQFRSSETLTAGGVNTPGYASPEVDDRIARLLATDDLAEARTLAREIDDRLATDLPYILLYSPLVTEAFRTEASFPATGLPGGLQAAGGLPSLVRITRG